MNEYEQNKREYPHAHQKQLLMKEARAANMVPPNNGPNSNVKRSTGIPRSFLQAASADTPGAKINPQGKFVLHFFQ